MPIAAKAIRVAIQSKAAKKSILQKVVSCIIFGVGISSPRKYTPRWALEIDQSSRPLQALLCLDSAGCEASCGSQFRSIYEKIIYIHL